MVAEPLVVDMTNSVIKFILFILFLMFQGRYLYGQEIGAITIGEPQSDASRIFKKDDKDRKPYPEHYLTYGFNFYFFGTMNEDRIAELSPVAENSTIWSYSGNLIYTWFFDKYLGVSFQWFDGQSSLGFTNLEGNSENYDLYQYYGLAAGIHFRILVPKQGYLKMDFTPARPVTSVNDYIYSWFVEPKIGIHYLYYSSEYVNLLRNLHGQNANVILPEDIALGFLLGVRAGWNFFLGKDVYLEFAVEYAFMPVFHEEVIAGPFQLGTNFNLGVFF